MPEAALLDQLRPEPPLDSSCGRTPGARARHGALVCTFATPRRACSPSSQNHANRAILEHLGYPPTGSSPRGRPLCPPPQAMKLIVSSASSLMELSFCSPGRVCQATTTAQISGGRYCPPRAICAAVPLRQLVEIVDERAHGGVEPEQLRVARFDQEVLVGGMGPLSVGEAEVAGRQLERLAGEHVARPRAARPRRDDR